MVKFYGVIFLGQPREPTLAHAHDAGTLERVGLGWLARGLRRARPAAAARSSTSSSSCRCSSARIEARTIGGVVVAARRRSWSAKPSYAPVVFLLVVALAIALTVLVVRRFYHGRVAARGAVGLRLRAARRAHAGHGRRLRPADPADLRSRSSRCSRELPSPFDRAPHYRVDGRRPDLDAGCTADRRARAARRASRRVAAAGPHRDVPALQLRHAARCCWCSCCERADLVAHAIARGARRDRGRAAVLRLGRLSAARGCRTSPRRASGCRIARSTSCSTRRRCSPRTRRRCSGSRRTSCSARWCCAAAIIPSMGTRLPFSSAADAIALVGLFAMARVFVALAAMDVGTAFGTLGARREMMVGFLAEPALLMVIFVASLISVEHGAARDRRTRSRRSRRALSEPRVHGRRVLDGAARRERAHPRRQSGHAPRAHDDPRGDDARVLGAALGAHGMGRGAQALQLRVHRLRAVRPVGHRDGGGARRRPRCSLSAADARGQARGGGRRRSR